MSKFMEPNVKYDCLSDPSLSSKEVNNCVEQDLNNNENNRSGEDNLDIQLNVDRRSYYFLAYLDSMGKCVSKQHPNTIGQYGDDGCGNSTSYIAISEPASDDFSLNEGQSESKKNAKRSGVETKGTAMSFGFKRKSQGLLQSKKTANSKQNEKEKVEQQKQQQQLKHEQEKYKEKTSSATVISNPGIVTGEECVKDDNGNKGSVDSLIDHETTTTARSPRLLPPKKDSAGLPYRPNRFGFRQTNVVRPASVGLTPKIADNDFMSNNNNYVTDKRRSKSATGTTNNSTRSVTPIGAGGTNLFQQQQHQSAPQPNQRHHQIYNNREYPKINSAPFNQYNTVGAVAAAQERNYSVSSAISTAVSVSSSCAISNQYTNETSGNPYTVVNTNIHTNPIVRPIPQPIVETVSKFTLHTASLPKPQYPVSISLTTRNVMDTKVAKQTLNASRRGFQGPRDISSDSGIASYDSFGDHTSPRRSKARPRHLQMVLNGKNSFEVRDLDDSLSDEAIVPLVLPKLPSAFATGTQPAPLSGLIRSSVDESSNDLRKLSIASSEIESMEEEDGIPELEEEEEGEEGKVSRDKSVSEKRFRNSFKDFTVNSKNSSPASSRASWCHAGDTMAFKDCSSLSISSSDESKHNNYGDNRNSNLMAELDDMSSLTLTTTGNPMSSLTITTTTPSFNTLNAQQQQQKHHQEPLLMTNVLLTIKDTKFAEIAEAAIGNDMLDDETSPTDSLVSSCTDSDELMAKRSKKKMNFSAKEKHDTVLDDISPEIESTSPLLSPGTPTHASNSFSLSDGAGRDFLIDDEIADQPALVYDGKDHGDDTTTVNSFMQQSITDTPTIVDNVTSTKTSTLPRLNKPKTSAPSPMHSGSTNASNRPKNPAIKRTESLDTLSPCDSIASDDLMMDFECHSSMDSIDRGRSQNGSGSGSGLHSMDETQLWSEIEAQGGDIAREWGSLLRSQRQNSRESITSQLPARATRLLNRTRIQGSPSIAGSDSPRSLDSVSRRTSLLKSHTLNNHNTAPIPDDMVLVDRSEKNAMLSEVMSFKKQLVRLRRLLQEDEDVMTRTETLNPFEHGQFFASCGIDRKQTSIDERDSGSLTPSMIDDPRQELSDLRRQVVFLQGQMDDKDRTIKQLQNLIGKFEEEKEQNQSSLMVSNIQQHDTVNSATQTERLRPISMGQEGIARTEQPSRNTSINYNPLLLKHKSPTTTSIRTTLTAKNQITATPQTKTVRTTQIGNVSSTRKPPAPSSTSTEKIDKFGTLNAINISNKNQINGVTKANTTPSKKIPVIVKTQYNSTTIPSSGITNRKHLKVPNSSSGNSSLNSSCSSLNDNTSNTKQILPEKKNQIS